MRTPIRTPEANGWETFLRASAQRLLEQTGQDLSWWNARVLAEGPSDESGLKAWLAGQGVTGYSANLPLRAPSRPIAEAPIRP